MLPARGVELFAGRVESDWSLFPSAAGRRRAQYALCVGAKQGPTTTPLATGRQTSPVTGSVGR